jgi:hypothetical protein
MSKMRQTSNKSLRQHDARMKMQFDKIPAALPN